MRSLRDALPGIAREFGLDIQAGINLDATSDQGDGEEGRAIYRGTIGKALPFALVIGHSSHAAYPFEGVSAQLIASEIVRAVEANPALCDTGEGEVSPPPICLEAKDLRGGYEVTTPERVWLGFNWLSHPDPFTRRPGGRGYAGFSRRQHRTMGSRISSKAGARLCALCLRRAAEIPAGDRPAISRVVRLALPTAQGCGKTHREHARAPRGLPPPYDARLGSMRRECQRPIASRPQRHHHKGPAARRREFYLFRPKASMPTASSASPSASSEIAVDGDEPS